MPGFVLGNQGMASSSSPVISADIPLARPNAGAAADDAAMLRATRAPANPQPVPTRARNTHRPSTVGQNADSS
jgi:hypothetical protein